MCTLHDTLHHKHAGQHGVHTYLERQFHEIALHTAVQCRQALRLGQLIATLNLILVEGDTGHLGPSVCSDVATRTTNATSTVEHLKRERDEEQDGLTSEQRETVQGTTTAAH